LGCELYGRLFTPEDRGKGFSPVQVITAAWEIQLVAIGAPAACGLRHQVLACGVTRRMFQTRPRIVECGLFSLKSDGTCRSALAGACTRGPPRDWG